MIINTGMRTDIPAFYSEWFMNRIREGYVLVRNPYRQDWITRYELDPEVVDCIAFCTKNPAPMLKYIDELKRFHQYWFVTITPYGKDVELNVPPKEQVMQNFITLSKAIGVNCVGWRYDPIFIDSTYTLERHLSDFETMCRTLSGYTEVCVISFIDIYEKVTRNFPQARTVNMLIIKPANYEDIEKEWLFQRSIPVEENGFLNDYPDISRDDFDSALETIIAQSKGEKLPEGYVPQTVYYLWDDDTIVGTFHFRHYLCQSLIEGAGHIGYYIAPEYRGKGYASQGLKLLIDEIRDDVQDDEIYLRVNRDNPASLRAMLNNGGYIHHQDDTKYYVRIKK